MWQIKQLNTDPHWTKNTSVGCKPKTKQEIISDNSPHSNIANWYFNCDRKASKATVTTNTNSTGHSNVLPLHHLISLQRTHCDAFVTRCHLTHQHNHFWQKAKFQIAKLSLCFIPHKQKAISHPAEHTANKSKMSFTTD